MTPSNVCRFAHTNKTEYIIQQKYIYFQWNIFFMLSKHYLAVAVIRFEALMATADFEKVHNWVSIKDFEQNTITPSISAPWHPGAKKNWPT